MNSLEQKNRALKLDLQDMDPPQNHIMIFLMMTFLMIISLEKIVAVLFLIFLNNFLAAKAKDVLSIILIFLKGKILKARLSVRLEEWPML